MQAADRLFGTFELLEAILYELPQQTLLLSQRVSSQWRAVISESTKLQQALFLKPLPTTPVAFIELPDYYYADPAEWGWMSNLTIRKCISNPLLEGLCLRLRDSCLEPNLCNSGRPANQTLEDVLWLGLNKPRDMHSQSWAKMLPTQPPVESCIYVKCSYKDQNYDKSVDILQCSPAIRLGNIVRELDTTIKDYAGKPDLQVRVRLAAPFELARDLINYGQLEDLLQAPMIQIQRERCDLLSWVRKTRVEAS